MNDKKHVVILGSGTAGAMLANKISKKDEVMVTVIDSATEHYYQPGFLFAPFGKLDSSKLSKPTTDVIKDSVYFLTNPLKVLMQKIKL